MAVLAWIDQRSKRGADACTESARRPDAPNDIVRDELGSAGPGVAHFGSHAHHPPAAVVPRRRRAPRRRRPPGAPPVAPAGGGPTSRHAPAGARPGAARLRSRRGATAMAQRLASLFTDDGFAVQSGSPIAERRRGRAAIAKQITGPGGELQLTAYAYAVSGEGWPHRRRIPLPAERRPARPLRAGAADGPRRPVADRRGSRQQRTATLAGRSSRR